MSSNNTISAEELTAVFSDLGPIIGSIAQAMPTLARPAIAPIIEAAGLDKPGLLFMLITTSVFSEPVTAEMLRQRSPYSALNRYNESFATLLEMGFMAKKGNGYIITDNGSSLLHETLNAFHKQLGTVQPTVTDDMPLEEWNRLAYLLERLSQACLNAGDPPGTWCIDHIQGLPMPAAPCPLDRIDKVLDDLNAFRDDAHIAAFKPYKIEGHVWELFTALWREDVRNSAEMAEKYQGRGHSETAYQHAFLDLVKRDWVEKNSDGDYVLTENGRSLREEVETQTDMYYYLPWGVILPDAEELHTLLTKAEAALKKAVEISTVAVPA